MICREAAANSINSTNELSEKERLQGKLNKLNTGWDEIEALLAKRLKKLDEALDESKNFQNQVREMIGWLNEAEAFLKGKRPTGGKPESAKAQIEKHKVCMPLNDDSKLIHLPLLDVEFELNIGNCLYDPFSLSTFGVIALQSFP